MFNNVELLTYSYGEFFIDLLFIIMDKLFLFGVGSMDV